MVAVTASKTSSRSLEVGRSWKRAHQSAAVAAGRAVSHGGAYLVRTVDLVRKDVQQHLGVGLGAQVPLVRQLALRLQGGPQLLRVRQVAIVDLRRELREPRRGRQ